MWNLPYTEQLLRFNLSFFTKAIINPAKVYFFFIAAITFIIRLVILDYNISVETLLVLTQAVTS